MATDNDTSQERNDIPIQLLTPMILKPNAKLVFSSPGAVEVRSIEAEGTFPTDEGGPRISAAAPITMLFPKGAVLVPTLRLGVEFTRGFTKMPDELKVKILEYNVLSNSCISHQDMKQRVYYYDGEDEGRHVSRTYFDHLRMTPEIAALSREIFYRSNRFTIDTRFLSAGLPFTYPRAPFSHQIRFLQFEFELTGPQWSRLVSFAQGKHDFPKLQNLALSITWNGTEVNRLDPETMAAQFKELVGEGVHFPYDGKLFFKNECLYHIDGFPFLDGVKESLENWLRTRITFETKGKKNSEQVHFASRVLDQASNREYNTDTADRSV